MCHDGVDHRKISAANFSVNRVQEVSVGTFNAIRQWWRQLAQLIYDPF